MRRLELKRVRVCSRCGRGRAELEGADGERIEVVLDAPRARDLSGQNDDVRSLTAFVIAQAAESQTTFGEVILDRGPAGLRALLSVTRAGESDVVACTAQEGVELAVRAGSRCTPPTRRSPARPRCRAAPSTEGVSGRSARCGSAAARGW